MRGRAAAAPGDGTIVGIEWDFDSTGELALRVDGSDGSDGSEPYAHADDHACVSTRGHLRVDDAAMRLINPAGPRVVVSASEPSYVW